VTDGTPDLASAAKSAADFLDSYTDESELAQRSPLLVEIMRAHAAEVRAALAAHDQQDEPTAAIPLPGEGWYSVTVEHLVDKFEKQHPTQTWEVVSRCDGGGFSVEPMTYPEPGVSDTPEPPPESCKTCQDRGWVWEGNASAGEGTPADCPDPVHASDYASAGNPPQARRQEIERQEVA
jgi:hypothetical protein